MQESISRIDITPLVGVALILVIIFMVTSPLIMAPVNMGIDLPKARTVEAKSHSSITVSCSRSHQLALNELPVSLNNLQQELEKLLAQDPQQLVVIRADKYVAHKQVLQLLAIAKRAGARRLAIATLQRNREKV